MLDGGWCIVPEGCAVILKLPDGWCIVPEGCDMLTLPDGG